MSKKRPVKEVSTHSNKRSCTASTTDRNVERRISRVIHSNTDGSSVTYEDETSHEHATIQQFRIEQEVKQVRAICKRTAKANLDKMLTQWQNPLFLQDANMSSRSKSARELVQKTLQERLGEQVLAAMSSSRRFGQSLYLHKHKPAKQPSLDALPHRSEYVEYAIGEYLSNESAKEAEIQMQERMEIQSHGFQAVVNQQAGLMERVTPPEFPFSDMDLKIPLVDLEYREHNHVDTYRKFAVTAVETRGREMQLQVPFIAHYLTAALLQVKYHHPLPTLVTVNRLARQKIADMAFADVTPSGYWGNITPNQKRWFASCQFRVGHIVFEDVWIELSLLVQSPVYRKQAYEATMRHVWEPLNYQLSNTMAPEDFLQYVGPNHPVLAKLKMLTNEHQTESQQTGTNSKAAMNQDSPRIPR